MDDGITRRDCCVLLGNAALAPALTRVAASSEDYPKLSRGINFHHALNWPEVKSTSFGHEYAWPPFAAARYKTSEAELDKLRRLGFDFIRLTVDPGLLISVRESRRAELYDMIKAKISRLLNADFKVVLDLHPVAANPDFAPKKVVESSSSEAFLAYAEMVGRTAGAMNELPHDRFALELMNEPWLETSGDRPKWQSMLETLHQRARERAPSLPLILTGIKWDDLNELMLLDIAPFENSNVMYTFHYYDPHSFTHQGLEKLSDSTHFIAGLDWPPRAENIASVRQRAAARISAESELGATQKAVSSNETMKFLSEYERSNHSPHAIENDFAKLSRWAATKSLSADRILLGEFGCVASADGVALSHSRLAWLRSVRMAAEEFNFPWALWAYKGHGGFAFSDADTRKIDADVAAALGLTP